jgi:molecular chaperone GrpE
MEVTRDQRVRKGNQKESRAIESAGGAADSAAQADLPQPTGDAVSAEAVLGESRPSMDPGGGRSGVPAEPTAGAVHRLEEQLDEAKDRYLRLAAEFDNYRKRVARERTELVDRAQAALLSRLLDALDDFDRLNADRGSASVESLREAMGLVSKKLRKELEAAGLEAIDPVGTPFDPGLHEAVSVVAPPTSADDHQVSATFQTGYRFKGTLVRPARVQVYAEGQA